jgi:hypothetical protein
LFEPARNITNSARDIVQASVANQYTGPGTNKFVRSYENTNIACVAGACMSSRAQLRGRGMSSRAQPTDMRIFVFLTCVYIPMALTQFALKDLWEAQGRAQETNMIRSDTKKLLSSAHARAHAHHAHAHAYARITQSATSARP